jgi:electron transfer flavoprotein beta subunit
MNSVVCLKRVPDTTAEIKVAADGKSIDTAGIEMIINPYDEYALESALRLRESTGGEVVVLSIGPPDSTKEIRTALAMGADRAILLSPPAPPGDSLSTARALVAALADLEYDVLFFGARAVDSDNFQTGSMVSEILGLPLVSEVVELTAEKGRILVTREERGGHATIGLPTPCGVTFQKGLHDPRYATLPGIMKSKKKPLEQRDIEVTDSRIEVLSLDPPAARPTGKIVGEGPDAVPELFRLLREEAKVL